MGKLYNRKQLFWNYMNSKKQFKKMPERPTRNVETKIMQIKDILKSDEEKAYVFGKINRIVQTGGPTVFVISDGTGSFSLKGFIKPGERAFPELAEEDSIKALIKIEEFNGETEGDIIRINKLDNSENAQFLESLKKIELERAKVIPPKFLVKSSILEKLEKSFIKAATEIRLAIIQDRPIIVRHHNDTDGYSSGFTLERAILPLIEEQHGNQKASWEFFTRAPSTAPFYEIDDSIRDTALSLRNVAKFSNKMPLIIIADNGSSPEDLIAIKQGKVHGSDFIVVDHHYFDEDVISKEVLTHINPFLVGEDGSHFSAGMLCAELARFINPNVKNIEQVPALSGFADRIDIGNPEVMKDYLKIAEQQGYTKQLLSDIALVIEYVSSKVRFMEVREYIEVLFGEPRDKQKALVSLMSPHIRELDKKGLKIGQENAHLEKIGKVTLQTISIEETFPIGFFPKPGRAVGLAHDALQIDKKITSLVTAGIMNTAITLRATDEANFSVHELIQFIDKNLPEAFINGGGHKNAGSITFIPNKKQKVVELLKEFIKSR